LPRGVLLGGIFLRRDFAGRDFPQEGFCKRLFPVEGFWCGGILLQSHIFSMNEARFGCAVAAYQVSTSTQSGVV
jgi:hypothetical protein